MQSEFVEIIPAVVQESQAVNPIARVLQGKKGSAMKHLVESCHCKLDKHQNITDVAGKVILLSQCFQYYGINTVNSVRCVICNSPLDWSILINHLEDEHRLKIGDIYKLFLNNFNDWVYFDGRYSLLGEPISFEKIQT